MPEACSDLTTLDSGNCVPAMRLLRPSSASTNAFLQFARAITPRTGLARDLARATALRANAVFVIVNRRGVIGHRHSPMADGRQPAGAPRCSLESIIQVSSTHFQCAQQGLLFTTEVAGTHKALDEILVRQGKERRFTLRILGKNSVRHVP